MLSKEAQKQLAFIVFLIFLVTLEGVIGYGRNGQEAVAVIRSRGIDCIFIDRSSKVISEHAPKDILAVSGDAKEEDVLLKCNIKAARALVRQKRVNETSYGTVRKKITLWRYDLWFLHKIEAEWKLDTRAFVWRAYLPVGDDSGVVVLKKKKALGGVDLRKLGSVVKVELSKDGE